jgi:hypothetical protein
MKSKLQLAFLTVMSVITLFAGNREDDAIKALRGVPPPELAARVASIIGATPADSRSAVATAILEAVSQRTPSSAPAVRTALVNSGALPPAAKVPAPAAPQAAASATNPKGNSRFPTAPPHGGNPPGLNGQPDRKGPPAFVDYTKPRSF